MATMGDDGTPPAHTMGVYGLALQYMTLHGQEACVAVRVIEEEGQEPLRVTMAMSFDPKDFVATHNVTGEPVVGRAIPKETRAMWSIQMCRIAADKLDSELRERGTE